jgi:hypothetical protein
MNAELSALHLRYLSGKSFFSGSFYETQLRPFEALNLLIENWDREQQLVTAVRVKQKTAPAKGDRHKKILLPSKPRTAFLTGNTNLMVKMVVSNRKKGHIFANGVVQTLLSPGAIGVISQ